MSKWISGEELLKKWDIQDFELFYDFVKKGLQPHTSMGKPISPSDIMAKVLDVKSLELELHQAEKDLHEYEPEARQEVEHFVIKPLVDKLDRYKKAQSLEWNEFELPEGQAQASRVLLTIVHALFHIDQVQEIDEKQGLKHQLEEPPLDAPDGKKQKEHHTAPYKRKVQAVAKMLYDAHPEIDTIKELVSHPKIKEAGGKHFSKKTRHEWISEVAPPRAKKPGIRPKKKHK